MGTIEKGGRAFAPSLVRLGRKLQSEQSFHIHTKVCEVNALLKKKLFACDGTAMLVSQLVNGEVRLWRGYPPKKNMPASSGQSGI